MTALEIGLARVEGQLDSIGQTLVHINGHLSRIDGRFDRMEDRLERMDSRLNGRIDSLQAQMLTRWDVFQVIVYVIGAAVATALLGPRLLALLPPL